MRDPGLILESERPPGGGHGNPLQYSFLENPMDRGAWWATVHGVAKSRTQLSDFTFSFSKGLPVHHQLPEITQTHVHQVGDACSVQFNSPSHVQLFAIPRTAAHYSSLSITNFQSLLKLMSMESVMSSNRLILCRPLLLLPSFLNESVFSSGDPSIEVSASASVLPMNIQD